MNPFTISVFAVACVCILSSIKSLSPHISTLAVTIAGCLIFIYILQGLTPFLGFFKELSQDSGMSDYIAIMLKALAISLSCRMSAEICRDCGENSLAEKVELAGKAGIVIISLPLVRQLLSIAKDMI